ncbi:MAG: holo-[acyl-carrier-protein] synthase [Ignavibacteria bacterium]|nr:holo-[acyl-carrier-protein] synthase [Ignavibacteria bacterium]
MIVGIGTDVVDVPRILAALDEYGERFLVKVFTDEEIAYCNRFGETRYLHFAARFAAKEAFSKAVKTGMRDGMSFKQVGIRNLASGEPIMELFGTMQERWGSHTIHVSLSHTATVALAVVVIESVLQS